MVHPGQRRRLRQRHPVTDDLEGGETKFSGRVRWVQIDIDEAGQNLDHLITPEERLRIAMTRH